MARKRQYKKRHDYRKGGRVRYQAGGAPQRKDYDTAREYNLDLAEYRKSQPAPKAAVQPGFEQGFLGRGLPQTPAAPPARREKIGSLPEVGGISQTPFLGSPGGIDLPTQGPVQQYRGRASEAIQTGGNVGAITQQPNMITQQPQVTPVPAGQPLQQRGQPVQQAQPAVIDRKAVAADPERFGLDKKAVAADPERFENFLRQAQEQENRHPGSTLFSQQGQAPNAIKEAAVNYTQSLIGQPNMTVRNMAYTREDMLRDQAREKAMTPAQKEARLKTQEELQKAQLAALAQAQAQQGQPDPSFDPNNQQMMSAQMATASAAIPEEPKSNLSREEQHKSRIAELQEQIDRLTKGPIAPNEEQEAKANKLRAELSKTQDTLDFMEEKKSMDRDGNVKPPITPGGDMFKKVYDKVKKGEKRAGESYTDPTQTQDVIDKNKIPDLVDETKVDTNIGMGTTTLDSDAQVDAGPDVVATTVDAPEDVDAATYQAETVADQPVEVDAATGQRPDPIADVQGNLTAGTKYATSDEVKVKGAEAKDADFAVTSGYLVDEVEGEDTTVADTPDAEKQTRNAITGEPAPDGVEAAITDSVGYEAAKRREVKVLLLKVLLQR